MSENRFRSSVFGGFNRRDVVGYIERSSQEATSVREENDALRAERESLRARLPELAAAAEERDRLTAACTAANETVARLQAEAETREKALAEVHAKLTAAQQTVDVFEDTRARLSQLEVDAARRAVEMEKDAEQRATAVLDGCETLVQKLRDTYSAVCRDTDASAAYVRTELSKLSDRLSQLAGLMEESANDFSRLDKTIEEGRNRLGAENL